MATQDSIAPSLQNVLKTPQNLDLIPLRRAGTVTQISRPAPTAPATSLESRPILWTTSGQTRLIEVSQ